ncbi:glycosyltransferase family 4 protein [Cyanobium sp. ATX 6A2]|uniref:glycosyltransferase family 4 protein n=1 Tax=Cyanobium sp. ATX 6A2 TaxID=2823700 RepID=UPI0020CD8105|nr:glycosyltransferase family 4 protein [Cyanobium sp. ATX 6A2]MCP9888701.1 glycosyltransferase family 4 protein [Cyanobium sp. ATX 6A2]
MPKLNEPLPAHSHRLFIHFIRFGPYHLARLGSARDVLAAQGWDVVGLETASLDSTYAWKSTNLESDLQRITVFPDRSAEQISLRHLRQGIARTLDRLQPSAVAIAGWAQPDALSCLRWCRRHRARSILMSETREADGNRSWWKERLKARRVRAFDAALVGGRSHQAYLRKLGFQGPITTGYDVVDDRFFATEASRWRLAQRDAAHQPRPYLLASNRFIPRKNLPRLVEAFAEASASSTAHTRADLCLLGDGEQRQALEGLCTANGLPTLPAAPWDEQAYAGPAQEPRVLFPGFRQIEELPRFYAHALALVHPALAEPWGLVINEAMAAGLPILSSSNVGAAEELLDDGVNGYRFDPTSTASISLALLRFLALNAQQRQQMGQMSERLLAARCPTLSFGQGLCSLLGQS